MININNLESDKQLVLLAKKNPDDFQAIMARYWNRLFGYVKRMSYFSQEDIEDILQEVFVKIYRYLNDYDDSMTFSTWIYKITRNCVIDEIRKRKSRPKDVWLEANEWRNIFRDKLNLEKELSAKISLEKVIKIIEKLPFEYKEVLILRFLEEKNYEEIMDILQKPKGTIASLIARGRTLLLKEIKEKVIV